MLLGTAINNYSAFAPTGRRRAASVGANLAIEPRNYDNVSIMAGRAPLKGISAELICLRASVASLAG